MESPLARLSIASQRIPVQEKRESRGGYTHVGAMATTSAHPPSSATTSRTGTRVKCRTPRNNLVGTFNSSEAIKNRKVRECGTLQICSTVAKDIGHSYIQATCQLVLSPESSNDYLTNPDALICWESVAEVEYHSKDGLECPICLYPPVAPRMGRCGHVYCWACAVQYIGYENASHSKKCAVCINTLHEQELKRVRILPVAVCKLGCIFKMVLLKRKMFGCKVVTVGNATHCVPSNSSDNAKGVEYSCVSLGDAETLVESDLLELDALKLQKSVLEADVDDDIIPYVTHVISELSALVKSRSQSLRCLHSDFSNVCPDFSESTKEEEDVYFYQASDGQSVFLHGLNWQCLLTEYGGPQYLPHSISSEVLSLKHYTMDRVLRKRWRHLNHLPVGRAFTIVELDLRPPLVSESTLSHFATTISAHQLERERQKLMDLELTQLKEIAENRIPTLPSGFVLCAPAPLSAPSFSSSDFEPLTASTNKSPKTPSLKSSFAEITKSGALPIVGRDRVANFTRRTTQTHDFRAGDHEWPVLGSKCEMNSSALPSPSTWWRRSLVEPLNFAVPSHPSGSQCSIDSRIVQSPEEAPEKRLCRGHRGRHSKKAPI